MDRGRSDGAPPVRVGSTIRPISDQADNLASPPDPPGPPSDANAARRRLASHLRGSGIEVAPGRYPFQLLPQGVEVCYVGHMAPYEQQDAEPNTVQTDEKPEAATGGMDVALDLVTDLNVERLAGVSDGSQDFVIASHLLEHLAEPLGFVDEIHRVLRPGGAAMILLPDRRKTEDRFRDPTPLTHLVAEHRSGVTVISDDHIVEYARDRGRRIDRSGPQRQEMMARLRANSFHVHVWDAGEFMETLTWGVEHLGHQWQLEDAILHEPPIHYEFGFLLRRAPEDALPEVRGAELRAAWSNWPARHRPEDSKGRQSPRLVRRLARQLRTAKRRSRVLRVTAEGAGAALSSARRLQRRLVRRS